MLRDYFELEGFRTLMALDAGAAIEAARRAPDAILLDVNLPGEDGFSVCRKIRDRATEAFWRGERTPGQTGDGAHMGLGLYICSMLARKHGGGIAVENLPDGGARVAATVKAIITKG